MIYFIYGILSLSRAQLTAQLRNGRMMFDSKSGVSMSLWQGRGLLQKLEYKHDVIHGFYLHEIGHWVYHRPVFAGLFIFILQSEIAFRYLGLPLAILAIAFGRMGEWRADRFAKEMGHGNELAEALQRMGYGIRTGENRLIWAADYITYLSTKIHNFVDKFLPISTHPSMRKRIDVLADSEQIIEESLLDYIAPRFQPIDKFLTNHIERIFPLVRS